MVLCVVVVINILIVCKKKKKKKIVSHNLNSHNKDLTSERSNLSRILLCLFKWCDVM